MAGCKPSILNELDLDQPTWQWATSMAMVKAELDHIVHDSQLRALRAYVLPWGRSDHLPVVGLFERSSDD